jgi:hypothetical protein
MIHQNQTTNGKTVKPCLHCGRNLTLSRWDSWNGFLVRCPSCGGMHGKRWNIRRVLFASVFFSAASFIFTMKPRIAVIAISVFLVCLLVGNYVLLDRLSDIVQLVVVSIFLFAPAVINAAILAKHEHDIERSVPALRSLQS